ncbi:DUF4145 domain-containing protein [Robbsia andropogonis]|uniref:DUF4145 domain-containing protein n=1 Tax=Robbsia andropogonis TaxID=28092 RepID=UPI003D1B0C02
MAAIFTFDCPHCGTKKLAFELLYAAMPANLPHWNGYTVCQICSRGTSLLIAGRLDISPMQIKGNLAPHFHVVMWWPQGEEPVAPDYVPAGVAKAFEEGARSLRNASPNAAVAMFRRAVDVGLKLMAPDLTTNVMAHRIDALAKDGRLNKDLAAWAHEVKLDGNAALHDIEEFDFHVAQQLEKFTEMLLMYLFTLPGMIQAKRAETAA